MSGRNIVGRQAFRRLSIQDALVIPNISSIVTRMLIAFTEAASFPLMALAGVNREFARLYGPAARLRYRDEMRALGLNLALRNQVSWLGLGTREGGE